MLCLALPAGASARAAVRLPAGEEAALRQRAAALFELRERAREGTGVALAPLAGRLDAMADTLEAAGLDSLAGRTRYRLAGVLGRLGRRAEAEGQLGRAVAAALRSRDVATEVDAKGLLVDHLVSRQPEAALAAGRDLAARLGRLRDTLALGDIHSTMARAWGHMGRWSEALAEARSAHRFYVRARHARQQAFALGQSSTALRHLGRHAEAAVATDSAIALGRRANLGLPLARALLERAALRRHAGRAASALLDLDEALAIDRRLGDRSHEASTRHARTTVLAALGRNEEALAETDSLLALPRVSDDPVVLIQALGARGELLLDLGRTREADSLLVAALERFEAHVARLVSEEARAGAQVHALRARSALAECRTATAGAEAGWGVLEAARAGTLRRDAAAAAPEAGALLARLAERHAALVHYAESPGGGRFAFVLADGAVRVARTAAADESDARAARALLAAGGPAAAREPLARLSGALLAPVLALLGPSVRRLVIVPPTDLEGLPFEALPLPRAPAGTLGERYAVSYAPSAGVLDDLERREPPRGRVVAFADPAVPGVPALPASRDEARRAAAGGACVLGREATRERFAREARQAAVLHVAAHAVAEPGAPSRRALRLAGADGVLTAAAVESLGCASDLVVLSGCSTAGGTRYRGEASFGLVRAFLAGGSRTVVATLWDVDDAEAARFMAAFYAHLRAGRDRDEALRRARRERAAAGSVDAWAFTLTGVGGEPVAALLRAGGRSAGRAK